MYIFEVFQKQYKIYSYKINDIMFIFYLKIKVTHVGVIHSETTAGILNPI